MLMGGKFLILIKQVGEPRKKIFISDNTKVEIWLRIKKALQVILVKGVNQVACICLVPLHFFLCFGLTVISRGCLMLGQALVVCDPLA